MDDVAGQGLQRVIEDIFVSEDVWFLVFIVNVDGVEALRQFDFLFFNRLEWDAKTLADCNFRQEEHVGLASRRCYLRVPCRESQALTSELKSLLAYFFQPVIFIQRRRLLEGIQDECTLPSHNRVLYFSYQNSMKYVD